ncbi:uncharacterized protein LOC124676246 [Lolium rigidum]|uniref:uncharacterized protein LOC124676246 n=1 Tax=Lolium rigidum TaxID=89674 RepID=UPI001F5DE3C6|nr:uncharacterized protein LOC124676246 [Lolium rigidum]
MSTYPVLNDQPIDQWKVTDLKDELCRRNLPISGLKEDLVKRLFEDLQGDVLGREGTVDGSSPGDDLKVDKTTASADASVCQAVMEPSVDENPSRVSTQSGDLVVSVTEVSKESEVATGKFVVTTEEVSQKPLAAAAAAEVSDAPLVDVLTTNKISQSGAAATKQDDLESAPSDSTMVKDVHEQAGGHSEFIAEKALEEDAAKKTIVDYLFATTDVKLDVTPAKGKLDDDILEHEVVPSPPDAIVPHADHWDLDAVAPALGHNGDALIPKISSVDSDLMNCKDHEDSGRTSNACKLTIPGPIDQTAGTLPATMPTYPVLKNRPIDQWKVTELKDGLSKRNLPIKGLKDDLVKRLFKNLEGDILGGSPCSYDLKVDRTPGSADASVCQDVIEQNVDEGPSQVATQEGSSDTTTDVSEDAVATTEEVNQTTLVAATDSDSPLVDSATADTISLSDTVATKRDDLESAPSDGAILKGASLKADCHSKIIAEKAPEEGTVKEAILDYVPYDVASAKVKLDATSAKGKLDADIVDKEALLSLPDAIALHTDHLDVHATATAPGQNAETLIPKIDSGDNAFMSSKDREDSGHTNDACKPSLSGTKDQVSEANPDVGSQIKCVLISHEDISTNVKGDLNADNSDLELEAKRDMVKPQPCRIPSVGDDLQALDDEKQLCKKGTPLQEKRSMTNMDLDKKEDSPNGVSPEKVNLERTSGNESIEEDAMESKHVIPNIRSDDVGREIEVTSDHEVKEVVLFDTVDSSVQTKDNVAKEKSVAPSEKRKPEDQVVAVDPNKRQRRVDSVKLPKEQTSTSSSICPKGVVQPAIKRSFGRSGSVASGDSHIERTVPLSQKPATTSLKIDRFVRPFTLKAVQELLGRTGSICSFWMDHIKTHCYVTYSSVDEAVATRNAVYNLQWPLNNGSYLLAEFVDPREVKLKLEHPPPPPAPISLSKDTTQQAVGFQQSKPNQTILPDDVGALRGLLPTPQPLKLFPASKPRSDRDMLPPPPKEVKAPAMSLADLFKQTQASPMIYYLPLTEEEVAAKLAARSRRRKRG